MDLAVKVESTRLENIGASKLMPYFSNVLILMASCCEQIPVPVMA